MAILIWEDWSLDIYKKMPCPHITKEAGESKKKLGHKKCLVFLLWLSSLVLMLKTQAGSCFRIAKFFFVTISIIWKRKSTTYWIFSTNLKFKHTHVYSILYEHQLVKELNEASNGHKRLAQENMQWYKDLSLLLHKKRIFSTLSWL